MRETTKQKIKTVISLNKPPGKHKKVVHDIRFFPFRNETKSKNKTNNLQNKNSGVFETKSNI